MFFNFCVGCFVFSRANLGLRCSPAGERTEAVEYKYVFLKSVTLVFGCVLVRKQWFQSCFKIEPPWLRYLSTHASCKVQHDEQSGTKKQRTKRIWFGGTFFVYLKICNDFSFESSFSSMLVRPDRRWWACVGLCRRLLTRGAFGKLICSNILRGLTWSYIPSVAMVIHVAERSRNQIAVEGCRSWASIFRGVEKNCRLGQERQAIAGAIHHQIPEWPYGLASQVETMFRGCHYGWCGRGAWTGCSEPGGPEEVFEVAETGRHCPISSKRTRQRHGQHAGWCHGHARCTWWHGPVHDDDDGRTVLHVHDATRSDPVSGISKRSSLLDATGEGDTRSSNTMGSVQVSTCRWVAGKPAWGDACRQASPVVRHWRRWWEELRRCPQDLIQRVDCNWAGTSCWDCHQWACHDETHEETSCFKAGCCEASSKQGQSQGTRLGKVKARQEVSRQDNVRIERHWQSERCSW